MTDLGHPLRFGAFLTPAAADPQRPVELAVQAERLGLDLVTVQDHPYQPAFLDTWTLLSVMAARTTSIRLAPDVASLPLRPPAVLARSVASLDLLSGGRVELGLGAGAFWDAIEAMGARRLSPREAVDALGEAIDVVRQVWDTGTRGGVRVAGAHHRVVGAKRGPAPAHPVEIWVGAYKPRMLGLVGRVADGWVPSAPYAPPDVVPGMRERIDRAAEEAGRDPAEIRRIYNVMGWFDAEQAEEFVALGFDTVIIWPQGDLVEEIERFAAEVVPNV